MLKNHVKSSVLNISINPIFNTLHTFLLFMFVITRYKIYILVMHFKEKQRVIPNNLKYIELQVYFSVILSVYCTS